MISTAAELPFTVLIRFSMTAPIWHTGSVVSAVAKCRDRSSALLVLVEPYANLLEDTAPASSSSLYARGATRALHRITFSNDKVVEALIASCVCLRLQDGTGDSEIRDLSAFVPIPQERPALFIISAEGKLLAHRTRFINPTAMVALLQIVTGFQDPLVLNAAASALAFALTTADSSSMGNPIHAPDAPSRESGRQSSMPLVVESTSVSTAVKKPAPIPPKTARTSSASTTATALKDSNKASPASRSSKGMAIKSELLQEAQTRLSVRLTDGKVVRKRFRVSESFRKVRDWVITESGLDAKDFFLTTLFPRRVYDNGEDGKMLSELQDLCPSASLVVTAVNRPSSEAGSVSAISAAASYVASAVGSFATFASGWFPTSGSRDSPTTARNQSTDPGNENRDGSAATSMAQLRRRGAAEENDNGMSYDNGNSTQFGSGGDGGSAEDT